MHVHMSHTHVPYTCPVHMSYITGLAATDPLFGAAVTKLGHDNGTAKTSPGHDNGTAETSSISEVHAATRRLQTSPNPIDHNTIMLSS